MNYDVFLSHSSQDKPFVRAMADWLGKHGVTFFLDEKDLLPGDRLSAKLGEAMEASRSAIICIGPHGEGPWQTEEIDSLLNKAIKLSRQKDEFRIIPVLLPDADTSNLRWFLETRLWVNLSRGITDADAELFRLRHAIMGTAADLPVLDDPDFNPYRGLKAFEEKDTPFFFGRAKECRELAAMVKEWRFACIVGPSGNGKSSLARAGLATDAAEARCPGIRAWKRISAAPAGDLLRAILVRLFAGLPEGERAATIDAAVQRAIPDAAKVTAESWASGLDNELKACFLDPQREVLILVDQFEEIFTHRGLGFASEEERQDRIQLILDALALLATAGDKRWRIVLTLRSDFFQRCRVSQSFWKLVSAERLNLQLDELDEEGWREAIKGPAARAGAYLEAGLVETMLKDVYRQRGSMPLLQLALHQLWRLRQGACLTHAAYSSIGGVANALQNRAESALKHLAREDPEYLEIARNLFLRLCSPGEGVSDTRRRLERSELGWESTDPAKVDHVLAELSGPDNRLIVADDQSLEVTHEVLIRECETVRGWIELARKEIPILRRLTHAARRWTDNDRNPIFLNAADPPRDLKFWINKTTLRLTELERVYWSASRRALAHTHREKRAQRRALLNAERGRAKEAELRADTATRLRQQEARQAKTRVQLLSGIGAVFALGSIVAGTFFLKAKKAGRETNRQLAEVNWQLAQQARGVPFVAGEISPISATHHLLKAAAASTASGYGAASRNAIMAARASSLHLLATMLHGGGVKGVTHSPDGQRILSWSGDGTVRLWEAASGASVGQPMKHEGGVWGAVFSWDGQRILSWSGDGIVRLWEAASGAPVGQPMKHKGGVWGAVFSWDGQRILSWSGDGIVRLWEAASGAPVGQPMKHEGSVRGAVFSWDGQRILSWSGDGVVRLWEVASGAPVGQPMKHEGSVRGAVFSWDGQRILSWSDDGIVRLWEAANGAPVEDDLLIPLPPESDGPDRETRIDRLRKYLKDTVDDMPDPLGSDRKRLQSLLAKDPVPDESDLFYTRLFPEEVAGGAPVFSWDGQRVLSWSDDGTVQLWEAASGTPVGQPMKHGGVRGAVFSWDGQRVLSWSDDGTVQLWEAANGAPVGQPMKHGGSVLGAVFSWDGQRILSWSDDGTARLWEAASGTPVDQPMKHGGVRGAVFSWDGQRILSWSRDGIARLWETASGAPVGQPMKHEGSVRGAVFSWDGQRILSWSDDGTARLWEAASRTPVDQPMKHRGVRGAVFSWDGQRIVSWSDDGIVQLWEAASGTPKGQPMEHGGVRGAVFSWDGQRILSWSDDGTARLWDAASGAPVGQPMKHGGVRGAVFSWDGQRILSWSDDGTARLWEAASGAPVGQPMKHEGSVRGAVFSWNGQRILSWSDDGTARLWEAANGAPVGRPMKHEGSVLGAVFSWDGQRILSWSRDGIARLWEAARGTPVGQPMKHKGSVWGAVFSWDGQRILSWSDDDTARLWDAASGTPVDQPMKHGGVRGAVFSWDGQRILSWSRDGIARLWETASGAPVGQPMKHEGSVRGAVFSWDGQRILSWSDDGTARLWEAASGALITLFPNITSITEASFDPQEQRILTTCAKSGLQFWDISFDPEIPVLERVLEFEVRSATTLASNGTVRVLSEAELAAKRKNLADLRSKRKLKL